MQITFILDDSSKGRESCVFGLAVASCVARQICGVAALDMQMSRSESPLLGGNCHMSVESLLLRVPLSSPRRPFIARPRTSGSWQQRRLRFLRATGTERNGRPCPSFLLGQVTMVASLMADGE